MRQMRVRLAGLGEEIENKSSMCLVKSTPIIPILIAPVSSLKGNVFRTTFPDSSYKYATHGVIFLPLLKQGCVKDVVDWSRCDTSASPQILIKSK